MSQSSEILMSFCAGKIGARQLSPETHEKNLAYLCEMEFYYGRINLRYRGICLHFIILEGAYSVKYLLQTNRL